MDFATAADELYSVPPSGFTAARKRLADELPRDEARRLTALHKPTVPAWAVNLLVRDGAVEPLLDLGERMRRAWSYGGDVGALERERGDLVGGLVRRARELADAAGRPLTDAFARDVEDTLQAAIADTSAAEEVRTGRLRRSLSHSGFGPLGAVPQAAASTARPEQRPGDTAAKAEKARRGTTARTASEADARAALRREAQRRDEEARTAETRAGEADRSLADWRAERDAVRRRLATAEDAAARLRERLRAAEAERADLERQAQVAEREHGRAERVAERARRDADAARRRADDARRGADDTRRGADRG